MPSRRYVLFSLLAVVLTSLFPVAAARADGDPGALWHIVHDQCAPNQAAHGDPAPCAMVDPAGGYAVLKDLVGPTQFLLIPTRRSSGIDDPAILDPGAPNYFAAAWRARSFVNARAGVRLPRAWLSLAINSAFARSQDQLHIHVDCLRPDVHDALAAQAAAIGPQWARFPVPLAGRNYDAMAVTRDELDGANPVDLLADGVPGARADMAARTLVVVGSVDAAGRPGFVLLTDRADVETGDLAEGEELQDHDSCPRLAASAPGK